MEEYYPPPQVGDELTVPFFYGTGAHDEQNGLNLPGLKKGDKISATVKFVCTLDLLIKEYKVI